MEIFKKILFVFILFFLAFNYASYAEVVKKIEVKGNERISAETIVIFGDVAINEDYKSASLSYFLSNHFDFYGK